MVMNFIDTNARLLHQLLEEHCVPVSSTKSAAASALFGQLQQAGIICKRRKGGGNQFLLEHPESLSAFIEQTYPEGLFAEEDDDRLSRIQGVMQSRDSKTRKQLDFAFLNTRGTVTVKLAGQTHELAVLTNANTSLCLKISASQQCELLTPCSIIVTVENPTAFVELEQMFEQPWNLAVYTAGKMSDILLLQLQCWHQQNHKLVHFGDYDYVGLLEFARILCFAPQAYLYYPAMLEKLLQQYGNTELLRKQVGQHKILLETVRQLPESLGKQQLIEVHQLLQATAKGLEQEGLYKGSQKKLPASPIGTLA
ncbi:MAG: hypothetical protein BWK73_08610 [Thiothrix lacustris]|uniref:Wadjet protein JetD C-terminal domain-containing protein n=1 Tax=Thiothrix lacustris TaxID=525917 RepID=A0A1Y1QVG5_9GAMM|nr:MAG: hypothetical protein BWK73_08610 [Thiothrix lacustris]